MPMSSVSKSASVAAASRISRAKASNNDRRANGAALAVHFARAGATVVLTARTEQSSGAANKLPGSLAETVGAVERVGGRAFAYPGDLAEPGERAAIVESALGRLGRVDVLVNNA